MAISEHSLIDAVTKIVVGASVVHMFLPTQDWLDDFPTAQKYYKAFVKLVGCVAIAKSAIRPEATATMLAQNKADAVAEGK